MRICLHAGPGAGKSTLTAHIFSELKRKNYNVELAHEYIKEWAYLKRAPRSFDQLYIFGKQLHREDVLLQCGVEHVVTDSPLLMGCCYAKKHGCPFWEELASISLKFEERHPSVNIFLDRSGLPYHQSGRYENYEQALAMDEEIRCFVSERVPLHVFRTTDVDGILALVERQVA